MAVGVGVDLGTAWVRLALVRDGILLNNVGSTEILNAVAVHDEEVLLGRAALEAAKPQQTVRGAKKVIGQPCNSYPPVGAVQKVRDKRRDGPLFQISKRDFSPEEITALLLERMMSLTGGPVAHGVVTVPAYFNAAQRLSLIHAGRLAGLKSVDLICDTSAAALVYARKLKKESANVVIFDLGAGGGSASLVRVNQGGQVTVLATSASRLPGGEDIDGEVLRHFRKVIMKTYNRDVSTEELEVLRLAWEEAKLRLSARRTVTTVSAELGDIQFTMMMSLQFFEKDHCTALVSMLEPSVLALLKQANMMNEDVDDVLLLGGCSAIPVVRRTVEDLFPGRELSSAVQVQLDAARGAALYAAALQSGQSVLREVMPHRMSYTLAGGSWMLCEAGAALPLEKEVLLPNPECLSSLVMSVDQGQGIDRRVIMWVTVDGNPVPQSLSMIFKIDVNGTVKCHCTDNNVQINTLFQSCWTEEDLQKVAAGRGSNRKNHQNGTSRPRDVTRNPPSLLEQRISRLNLAPSTTAPATTAPSPVINPWTSTPFKEFVPSSAVAKERTEAPVPAIQEGAVEQRVQASNKQMGREWAPSPSPAPRRASLNPSSSPVSERRLSPEPEATPSVVVEGERSPVQEHHGVMERDPSPAPDPEPPVLLERDLSPAQEPAVVLERDPSPIQEPPAVLERKSLVVLERDPSPIQEPPVVLERTASQVTTNFISTAYGRAPSPLLTQIHPSPTESSPSPERRSSTESFVEPANMEPPHLTSSSAEERDILDTLMRELHAHVYAQDLICRTGPPGLRLNPLDFSCPALVQYFSLQEDTALRCLADARLLGVMAEVRVAGRFALMVDTTVCAESNLVSLMLRYCLANGDAVERLVALEDAEATSGDALFERLSSLCRQHGLDWEHALSGVCMDVNVVTRVAYDRLLVLLRERLPDLRLVWNGAHHLCEVIAHCCGDSDLGREFLGTFDTLRNFFSAAKCSAVLSERCGAITMDSYEDAVVFIHRHHQDVVEALRALERSDWRTCFLARRLLCEVEGTEFKTVLCLFVELFRSTARLSGFLQFVGDLKAAVMEVREVLAMLQHSSALVLSAQSLMVGLADSKQIDDSKRLMPQLQSLIADVATALELRLSSTLCVMRDIDLLSRAPSGSARELIKADLFDWVPKLQRRNLVIEFSSARVDGASGVVPMVMVSRLLRDQASRRLYPNLTKGLVEVCTLPLLPGVGEVRKLTLLQQCLKATRRPSSSIEASMVLLCFTDVGQPIGNLDYDVAINMLMQKCVF